MRRIFARSLPAALALGFALPSLVGSQGCKKDAEAEARESGPSPTAVAEASLEAAPKGEAPAESTKGDRKLVTRAPRQGVESKDRDAPKAPRVPRARPAIHPAVVTEAAPSPEAPAPIAPPEPVLAAAPAPEAVPEPSIEPSAQPTGGGPRAGIMPGTNVSPSDRRLQRPGAARPPAAAPIAEPPTDPTAPPFDEGLDAPNPRAERVRPQRPNPARPELGPNGNERPGPAAPPMDAPVAEPMVAPEPGMVEPVQPPGMVRPGLDPRVRVALPTHIRPNAELLLRKEDMVEVLQLTRPVDVHALPGLVEDESYDAIYWGSADGAQYFAGVQVWKPRSPIEAQRRYTQMVRSYPNAEETAAVGTNAFFAFWNDFYYLVFRVNDNMSPSVVALTCHQSACDSPQKLVLLASKIFERLQAKEPTP